MDTAKWNRDIEVLRQVAKASDAIRQKYKLLKSNRLQAEESIKNVFKPVVAPLERLVHRSEKKDAIKREPMPVKKEKQIKRESIKKKEEDINKYNDDDDDDDLSFKTVDNGSSHNLNLTLGDDIRTEGEEKNPLDEKKAISLGDSFTENRLSSNGDGYLDVYLNTFDKNDKSQQKYCGIYVESGNYKIGDSIIQFENYNIYINDRAYPQTRGLLELLFRKNPNNDIIEVKDIKNYQDIVRSTNANRLKNTVNEPLRKLTTKKMQYYLSDMPSSSPIRKVPLRKHISGDGLPHYKIAHKRGITDYVYWDDPNELVDRLRLLMASQAAGNNGHANEIISIIEELREAGIIY